MIADDQPRMPRDRRCLRSRKFLTVLNQTLRKTRFVPAFGGTPPPPHAPKKVWVPGSFLGLKKEAWTMCRCFFGFNYTCQWFYHCHVIAFYMCVVSDSLFFWLRGFALGHFPWLTPANMRFTKRYIPVVIIHRLSSVLC